jgi:hypothetical protein
VAAATAMVLGMVGLAVEAAATVEVPATNEGGWTEDGLAGAVLVVAAGAAAAWEAAGSVSTGLGMISLQQPCKWRRRGR